jgi:predicted XRE-type DNA-binding protein
VSEREDAVLQALDELMAAARHNIVAWVTVMERVEQIRAQRAAGVPYTEIEVPDGSPRIIDAVTENQERLSAAAAQFRRAAARQMQQEGLTAAEIARVFGVTRQRVSALLHDSSQ